MAQTQQQIAETRRRYEELRAAGQDLTPKGLPEPTALDVAPVASDAVIHREAVPSSWYTTLLLRRAAAQELTRKGLPEQTALDVAAIARDAVIHREAVRSGWYIALLLRRGE